MAIGVIVPPLVSTVVYSGWYRVRLLESLCGMLVQVGEHSGLVTLPWYVKERGVLER